MNPLDEAMGLTPASAPVRQVSVDSTDEAAPGQPIGAARGVRIVENGASKAGRPKAGRRLQRALSVNTALRTMGKDGESLRELLGEQDLASKTFLKNLTRFHRLKRRLDHIAATILSASFREDPTFRERKPAQPPCSPRTTSTSCWPAARRRCPSEALVGDAVRKAGLEPRAQPNTFIEIAQGGDELYTAATLGPLKTRERCAEKRRTSGGDVRPVYLSGFGRGGHGGPARGRVPASNRGPGKRRPPQEPLCQSPRSTATATRSSPCASIYHKASHLTEVQVHLSRSSSSRQKRTFIISRKTLSREHGVPRDVHEAARRRRR